MLKRGFDLALSALGLLIFAPLLVLTAAAIKINSRGPVFYRGVRARRNGLPFRIYKFRTMVLDADKLGGSSTPEDDPRITRIGALLRKYKLDELPQLLNVLLGDMSFVGPRPQVLDVAQQYPPEKQPLLSVRPGITDYASLKFRDEGAILRGSDDPDRDYFEKIDPEKTRLGLVYVRSHSLVTDIRIIAATVGAILGVDPEWCLRRSGEHEYTHQS